MAHRARRVLRIAVLILVVLVVVITLVVWWLTRRPHPEFAGEVTVDGLSADVEVLRDDWGVPHIYASDPEDLFLAQGYVHAQDRFWQMEMNRRVGSGTLSALFGEDQIDTDRFLRTLGWRRVAEEEWTLLSEEVRSYLVAYAEGVNAYLADRAPSEVSFEYAVLGLQQRGLTIAPWDPVDTLVWIKVMAWDLRANMEAEIQRALLAADLPVERVEQLWPAYPDRHPRIVPDGEVEDPRSSPEAGEGPGGADPPTMLTPQVTAQLEELLIAVRAGPTLSPTSGAGVGSNSWVIAGDLSASGQPVLVNDPHLGAGLPSIWYETGLHCAPVGDDCPFDVRGFTFPGLPGVVAGRNARIAWGVTNLGADVTDLVIERVDPDDPDRYEFDGDTLDMEVTEEQIEVAGSDPVTHTIRKTRNGPVMSDVSEQMASIDTSTEGDLPDEHVISLRWTALQPAPTVEAVFVLNTAEDWESFRAAAELFDVPAQNLVYADVDGNIGYQAPGRIPVRTGGDGRWPVPGWTGEHEWTGYIPFDELPSVLNPSGGYLVTANNAVIGEDHPHHLTADTDWAHGYRAARIIEMIEAADDAITPADMERMLVDAEVVSARELLPLLAGLRVDDGRLVEARELLLSWDQQLTVDSAGGALYAAWWRHLLLRTFAPEVPDDFLPVGNAHERWYEAVRLLAEDPTAEWWDDPRSDGREERDDVLRAALEDAVDELTERLGDDLAAWEWGDLHTLDLVHNPLGDSGIGPLERLFNRGPYRTGGGGGIVNATGWQAAVGYEVVTLPSFRMVLDLGDPASSTAIHTTGQSGHVFHRHYVDMADRWAAGDTKSFRFDRTDVEEAAVDRLLLTPGS